MSKRYLLAILFLIPVLMPAAFGETPSKFNEWDFDLVDVKISQDDSNLKNLEIAIPILYKGEMPQGSVHVWAKVTDPRGVEKTHFGSLYDMEIGQTKFLNFVNNMVAEGEYTIEFIVRSTNNEYLGHQFDSEIITYDTGPNGFEKNLGAIGVETDQMISYTLADPLSADRGIVHTVINLPEQNMYERIEVTNGEFTKEYPLGTTDIFIRSNSGYESMNVNIIKEQTLLPKANAQNSEQDYINFFYNDRESCNDNLCVTIDREPEQEGFQWWWLLPLGLIGLAPLMFRNKKSKGNHEPINMNTSVTKPIMLGEYAKEMGP